MFLKFKERSSIFLDFEHSSGYHGHTNSRLFKNEQHEKLTQSNEEYKLFQICCVSLLPFSEDHEDQL